MRHLHALSFFCLFLAVRHVAATPVLKLKLELTTHHAVAGQPLPIKLVFSADEPIALPGFYDFCDGHLNFLVLDEAGKPADWIFTFPGCYTVDSCSPSGADKPSLTIRKPAEFEVILVPGEYRLQASYDSKGPYFSCDRTPLKFWEGSVRSQEEIIEVVPPGKADRNALSALGINEDAPAPSAKQYQDAINKIRSGGCARWIIKKYPESWYAAYAFAGPDLLANFAVGQVKPPETHSALELLNALRKEKNSDGDCKTDDKGQVIKDKTGNCLRNTQVEMQRSNIAVGEAILKNHPEFPYLDNAKYKLARAYLILGEDAKAMPLLEDLSASSLNQEHQSLSKAYLHALQEK